MERSLKHALVTLALPVLAVVGAVGLVEPLRGVEEAVGRLSLAGPLVLAAIVSLIAVWFHRASLIYPLTVVAGGFVAVQLLFPDGPGKGADGQVVYAALCLLLPINLTVSAFFEERGLVSLPNLSRFAVLGLQVAVVALVAGGAPWEEAAGYLHFRLLPPEADRWTYLPQPAMGALALSGAVLLVRAWWRGSPLDAGAFGALVATAVGLHMVGRGAAPALFFSLALLAYAVALAQETYRMAFLDELTGLPGRRALVGMLKTVPNRYVIAMLDVDHFKRFNDTYGHDVGDQVLKMVAACLAGVRGGGRAFRYGGEEFTVVFPRHGLDHAADHLDRLRQTVASGGFVLRRADRPEKRPKRATRPAADEAETVGVTISIGMAEKTADRPDPPSVLKAADQALYTAKKDGRNRLRSV